MTEPTLPGKFETEDEDDLLAAEYVLGTLPGSERRLATERIEVDGAFAARVRLWEARFAPLNADYEALPPPDILPQIETRLFGTDQVRQASLPLSRRVGFGWLKAAMGGAVAAALILVAVVFLRPEQASVVLRAEIEAQDQGLRFTARWDARETLLELSRVAGQPAPAGQDYQLWLIGENGVPQSLGLLRDTVTRVSAGLAPGQILAISLEPAGGSPDPTPSGPVLATAQLTEL